MKDDYKPRSPAALAAAITRSISDRHIHSVLGINQCGQGTTIADESTPAADDLAQLTVEWKAYAFAGLRVRQPSSECRCHHRKQNISLMALPSDCLWWKVWRRAVPDPCSTTAEPSGICEDQSPAARSLITGDLNEWRIP
jgi:hypothetical protein